jgi:hypothetical protein
MNDGSISQLSIQLQNRNPYQILCAMAQSINFPLPPPPLPSSPQESEEEDTSLSIDESITYNAYTYTKDNNSNKSPSSLNRNLLYFITKNINLLDDIKQRKLSRINANAAALVTRRIYKFSAIDGTKLKWSSASLVICLRRLIALHEEHGSKLHVKSFYPFRLVFSSDEYHNNINLYAGTIKLNPAATSLQWLGVLTTITEDSIRTLQEKQSILKHNMLDVEQALRVRLVQGHTCASEDYYHYIEQLATDIRQSSIATNEIMDRSKNSKLIRSNTSITLVIESNHECRHGTLRKDGRLVIGTMVKLHEVQCTINKYASRSNDYIHIENEKQLLFQQLVHRVMYDYGVSKINKVSSTVITIDDMCSCLVTLLCKEEDEKIVLRKYLTGQSIGIAGCGQLCHLGDDGSIVLPANCS